jgi:hypothetical protein
MEDPQETTFTTAPAFWHRIDGGWVGFPAHRSALLIVPADEPIPEVFPVDAKLLDTAPPAAPDGHLALAGLRPDWTLSVMCHDKPVRLRCHIGGTDWLRQRLLPLAAFGDTAAAQNLDLAPMPCGGYAIWQDGKAAATAGDPHELASELYGVLLQICLSPHAALLHLHAASVVVNDRPLILAAPSHGGKTTLAIALQARGATLLSDDTIAIDATDGSLAALPFGMRVRPNGWDLARAYLADDIHNIRPGQNGDRMIAPRLSGKVALTAGPAAAVILMERQSPASDARAGVSRLTAAEGLMGLVACGASLGGAPDDVAARALCDWANTIPFHWMTYDTPEQGALIVETFAVR